MPRPRRRLDAVALGLLTLGGLLAVAVFSDHPFTARDNLLGPAGELLARVVVNALGYAAGVLFGKHPMAPSISPKKSWEGMAGSVLACVLIGVLLVLPVGGADVPIVISLLNAGTGLAVAASGYILSNTVLLVGGTVASVSSDDAGRGIKSSFSTLDGRGI